MLKMIKRYKIFIVFAIINTLVIIFYPKIGIESLVITKNNLLDMLSVLPPIFILIGLFDVWVKRETLIKYMGKDSGLIGVAIAFFIGSVAAGPLYAAFPVAGVLLKKGSKLSNVFIMIGAWSTTKIPLLLFEVTSMGTEFTLIRLAVNLVGIVVIAYLLEKTMSEKEKDKMYENALIIN